MHPHLQSVRVAGALLLVSALLALTGCSTTDFVSDDPRRYGLAWGTVGSGEYPSSGTAMTTTAPSPELVATADVVQVEGDRLFALSYSGLVVVDLSDPDDLRTLGRAELDGQPFAMHHRDGVVYALFSMWRQIVDDGGGARAVTSSHLEALDVSAPEAITSVGAIDVPGALLDTRMIGSILYTVAYEGEGCWGCEPGSSTVVVRSFDTSDPSRVTPIDAVSVAQPPSGGWKTSFAETRIFVSAGLSTVQAIDVSDPAGHIVVGATIETQGAPVVMNEFDGALRVVSASPTDTTQRLETFSIGSSTAITPLASVELPASGQHYDVRFDGPRAYALATPIVALDLSNAAAPVVGAQLSSPAFVLQVEPRGDRLFVLALASVAEEAPLAVWLFDTADVAAPQLLATATFGDPQGDLFGWTRVMEIVPESGRVLVTYPSAVSFQGCDPPRTTVQLIDWTTDDLMARGAASLSGAPWRALEHDGRLVALSDEVATFDLSNPDAPTELDSVRLTAAASDAVVAGDWVVRLSAVGSNRLDVVPASDPGRAEPIGSLDVEEALADSFATACVRPDLELLAHDHYVYLVFPTVAGTRVVIVDIADPAHSTIAGHADAPSRSYPTASGIERVVSSANASLAQLGDQLVFERLDDSEGDSVPSGGTLTKLDLSDPTNPRTMTLELPSALGHSGIVADGDRLFFTHWVAADPDDTEGRRMRFYFDRVNVAPDVFELAPAINVPGSFVGWDAPTHRLLTADYQVVEEPMAEAGCAHLGAKQELHADAPTTCAYLKRTLVVTAIEEEENEASVVEEMDLPEEELTGIRMNGGAFLLGYDAYSTGPSRVHAVSGVGAGSLQMGTVALPMGRSAIATSGTTLVHVWGGIVTVVDATDVGAMKSTAQAVLSTTNRPDALALLGDQLLVSRGAWGLDVLELEK